MTVGDMLSELDRVISRCRVARGYVTDIDQDWANGVEDGLENFRVLMRSQAFARLVTRRRNRKETPTNAH